LPKSWVSALNLNAGLSLVSAVCAMAEKPKPKASANDRSVFMEDIYFRNKNKANMQFQTPV
jgi:hypothetical protein